MPPYKRRYKPKSKKYKPRRRRQFKRYRVPSAKIVSVPLRKTGTQSLTGTTTASNSTFKLNEFSNYSKFTAIYEQYRIVKIIQTIYPMFQKGASPVLSTINVSDSGGDGSAVMIAQVQDCLIGYKIDRDDVTGFSNIGDVINNPGARIKNGFRTCKIQFKPNTLTNMYGPVADNHAVMWDAWLDTEDSSDIDYYGLCKLFHADGCTSDYPLKYRVITTAIVQFKRYRADE